MGAGTMRRMTIMTRLSATKAHLRRVGALSLPYFRSEERWPARGLLLAIVALNLGTVYLLVLMNEWNRTFYDALQEKNQSVFWAELGRFCWLAASFIAIAVYKFYLTQLLEMRWRRWMTSAYLARWLSSHAFYQLELARFALTPESGAPSAPDNPDQRIQEDVNQFTSYTVSLSMGLLNALVTLVSFVGILWTLSGEFSIPLGDQALSIPGFMVWMALLYCIAGSLITHLIGQPLVRLNFHQQRLEADFRHHMVRVREYSESIALDRGGPVEQARLNQQFSGVLANYWRLLRTQKNLLWFTTGFAQVASVFPLVVSAPRFFAGAIQLGELMQIASAFGRVQDSLSWFVDNYDRLAAWSATADRLTSFEASLDALRPTSHAEPGSAPADAWTASELQVRLGNGEELLRAGALRLDPGDRVLLSGPSGSGKSSLLRTLAGIWPWHQGSIRRPADFDTKAMFLPQRAYLPLGSLRDALAYPDPASLYSDDTLRQALNEAMLPDLGHQLDMQAAWNLRLSGGEQQRLAIARVFLKKPRWLFVDEATSALDEATESALYQRMADTVRRNEGALVSIAHRASVRAFHARQWSVQGDAGARQLVEA